MTDQNLDSRGLSAQADAQASAALLLVESLIHTLVSKQVLTIAEAVETVDSAAEVSVALADEGDLTPPTLTPTDSLQAIRRSLEGDL